MATLKKLTRVGSDVRQIARLLQAKAPEGHMLAYITPEEAELLKSRGGSGKEHADTGIPSFEYDADSYYSVPEAGTPVSMGTPQTAELPPAPAPENTTAFRYPSGFDAPVPYSSVGAPTQPAGQARISAGDFGPAQDRFAGAYQGAPVSFPDFAGQARVSEGVSPALAQQDVSVPSLPPAMTGAGVQTEFATPPVPEKTFAQKAEDLGKYLDKNQSLVKLLGLGATGIGGLIRGRQGAREAESIRKDLGSLGQDYRRQGEELLAKARTGELTAPQQQQIQAAQAQLSQQATARGGVGALQAATQIEALRQQYVAQNMDRALQLLNIADQYQANAIKAGYAASKDAQAAADRFYAAMGQYLVPPSQQTQQTTKA